MLCGSNPPLAIRKVPRGQMVARDHVDAALDRVLRATHCLRRWRRGRAEPHGFELNSTATKGGSTIDQDRMSGFTERMSEVRHEQTAADAAASERERVVREQEDRTRRLATERHSEVIEAIGMLRDNRKASKRLLQRTLGRDSVDGRIFWWRGQSIADSSAPPNGWKGRHLLGGHEGWVLQWLGCDTAHRIWLPERGRTLVSTDGGYLPLETYVKRGRHHYSAGKLTDRSRHVDDPAQTLEAASITIARHLLDIERARA